MYFFIADTIFLFDEEKNLIAVPGAAGRSGDHRSNGSLNRDLQNSEKFKSKYIWKDLGYGRSICFVFDFNIFYFKIINLF